MLIGTITVFFDFSVYQGLIFFLNWPLSLAKMTGFIVGTLCAYSLNKRFTFKPESRNLNCNSKKRDVSEKLRPSDCRLNRREEKNTVNYYQKQLFKLKIFQEQYRFVLLYSFSCFVNALINSLIVAMFKTWSYSACFAFIFATLTSATINFLGMKFIVFHSPESLRTSL